MRSFILFKTWTHPHDEMSKFSYECINCVFYDVFTTHIPDTTQSASIFTRFDIKFSVFTLKRAKENSEKFMNRFSISLLKFDYPFCDKRVKYWMSLRAIIE